MKLTYLITVCFLLFITQNIIAQKIERQVLASAGAGIALVDVLQVEYTIGEAVIVPLTAPTGTVLTQGFQQPPTGKRSTDALNTDLVLYPNPSLDNTSIRFALDSTTLSADVRIVNLMGQTVFKDLLTAPASPGPFWNITYSFDTNKIGLIPGIYIFQLKSNTGFKVTKKFLKLK